MTKITVIYETDDGSQDIWSCEVKSFLECIEKFNKEIGGWVDRVIDWVPGGEITGNIITNN